MTKFTTGFSKEQLDRKANIPFLKRSAELISREVWGDKAKSFAEISFTLGIVFYFLLTLVPGALIVFAVLARFAYIRLIQ